MALASSKSGTNKTTGAAGKNRGIARLEGLVRSLSGGGGSISTYFSRISEEDIATSVSVKNAFSARLKQSREAPQIVTVQARGGETESEYVIVPIEEMNRLLEAQIEARQSDFVPITSKLKAATCEEPLPLVLPRKSGTTKAFRRRAVPAPQGTTGN
ncbi:hypothetical protein D2T29_21035 [Sinirhodobacter populi]|uniref:Uncharacterized protein n=1 Tax=Paenirhodobacter populi TaxID=2306993 RepID=A0A443K097_9RHOB|nr:hypothetical protein [Sinirhodobacter populi]RWR09185.1 hypothetical protein D2T33_14395 [Sinirhodobacter populi]RWR25891.1 hypothetical protein D2T31_21440 [Sinirhodobacter populi]RWR26208.1 hypothetical protein D2T29_21035 [Sinirhodobacter populi]